MSWIFRIVFVLSTRSMGCSEHYTPLEVTSGDCTRTNQSVFSPVGAVWGQRRHHQGLEGRRVSRFEGWSSVISKWFYAFVWYFLVSSWDVVSLKLTYDWQEYDNLVKAALDISADKWLPRGDKKFVRSDSEDNILLDRKVSHQCFQHVCIWCETKCGAVMF